MKMDEMPWKSYENPMKMDDKLGLPAFTETPV